MVLSEKTLKFPKNKNPDSPKNGGSYFGLIFGVVIRTSVKIRTINAK